MERRVVRVPTVGYLPHMASDHRYLIQLPDGTWLDTRYRFKTGDAVRITSGIH